MLKAIESRCFGIPVLYLFDLVVGTCSGGQIALALTTPAPSEPLTVTAATIKFRELMETSFESKSYTFGMLSMFGRLMSFLGGAKYNAKPLEGQLKGLFSEDKKLFSAATFSGSSVPNVAVTTVAEKPYLISN
jgi:patatin-like phospholipase/acyl hydrolase